MINKLEALYLKIHTENCGLIVKGKENVDKNLLDIKNDKRFGISLLIKLDDTISGTIHALVDEIKSIEPDQYYYPDSDLHITVLDLISAHEEFIRDVKKIREYISLVNNAIEGIGSFEILFRGILLSNIGVLAKGFYQEGLPDIRNRMREVALMKGIQLQERYQSISAHSTFIRFKTLLKNRSSLISYINNRQNYTIGSMKVKELSLVIHDWYNRRKDVLGTFDLQCKDV